MKMIKRFLRFILIALRSLIKGDCACSPVMQSPYFNFDIGDTVKSKLNERFKITDKLKTDEGTFFKVDSMWIDENSMINIFEICKYEIIRDIFKVIKHDKIMARKNLRIFEKIGQNKTN